MSTIFTVTNLSSALNEEPASPTFDDITDLCKDLTLTMTDLKCPMISYDNYNLLDSMSAVEVSSIYIHYNYIYIIDVFCF